MNEVMPNTVGFLKGRDFQIEISRKLMTLTSGFLHESLASALAIQESNLKEQI